MKSYECLFCKRLFRFDQALGRHERSHILNNSTPTTTATTIVAANFEKFQNRLITHVTMTGKNEIWRCLGEYSNQIRETQMKKWLEFGLPRVVFSKKVAFLPKIGRNKIRAFDFP